MSQTQVQSGFIGDNSVTSAQIADDNITTAKIAANAITTAKLDSTVSNSLVPIGGIIMWSGSVATIPSSSWKLCDGSNGTPDLRNRFVVGASVASGNYAWNATTGTVTGNYAPGNSGGEAAHKLTSAELASHTHPYRIRTNGSGGGDTPIYGLTASPTDTGGLTTDQFTKSNTGGDNYHENRPPYYALAFIMRVS